MANAALAGIIRQQRRDSFRPEYQASVSDAEALGIAIAHHFGWDGSQILEAAVAALTDANFHTEAAQVQAMR